MSYILPVNANILSAGMDVNAYLAFTVCGTMGYSFSQSLMLVLIGGYFILNFDFNPFKRKDY